MTTNNLAPVSPGAVLERVIAVGDLSQLKPEERVAFYRATCESVGLNPLTRPFEYLSLSGKLTLYANKGCAEQLRETRHVSIKITKREVIEGCYIVTAEARRLGHGGERLDEATGVVAIANLQGDARANAMMKAETKAKRRVTLSICGLGMLDESEVLDVPGADTALTPDGEPDPVAQDRRRLMDAITETANRMKLSPDERRRLWREQTGNAPIESVDPATLQDFLTALEERERGERV